MTFWRKIGEWVLLWVLLLFILATPLWLAYLIFFASKETLKETLEGTVIIIVLSFLYNRLEDRIEKIESEITKNIAARLEAIETKLDEQAEKEHIEQLAFMGRDAQGRFLSRQSTTDNAPIRNQPGRKPERNDGHDQILETAGPTTTAPRV